MNSEAGVGIRRETQTSFSASSNAIVSSERPSQPIVRASTSISMPLYDPSHLPEAVSWVHDLRRCVTTRSAALELGITRRAAAALLADLPTAQGGTTTDGAKYEVHFSRVVRRKDGAAKEGGRNNTCKF